MSRLLLKYRKIDDIMQNGMVEYLRPKFINKFPFDLENVKYSVAESVNDILTKIKSLD